MNTGTLYYSAAAIAAACAPPLSARHVRRLADRERWRMTKHGGERRFHIQDAARSLGTRAAAIGLPAVAAGVPATTAAVPTLPDAAGPHVPDSDAPTLADVSDSARRTAARRLQAVQQWERFLESRPAGSREAQWTVEFCRAWNIDPANANLQVSRRTLFTWRNRHRTGGVASLIDGRAIGTKAAAIARRKEIPAELWGAFARVWLHRNQLSVEVAYETAIGQQPAESQGLLAREHPVSRFYARVRELPHGVVVMAREGPKA